MMTKIPDIAFDIEGDTVHLEQSSGPGEAVLIDLHRIHLQHIAQQMGVGIGPDSREIAIATLSRNMRFLRELIGDLRELLEGAPCCPPGSGPTEDVIQVAALDDLAALFCENLPDADQEASDDGDSGPRSLDRVEGVGEHHRVPDNAQEVRG